MRLLAGVLGVSVFAVSVLGAACGDKVLKSDDFDQSCDVDSDCVVVVELGFCCSCEQAGINRDALEEYEEASDCAPCDASCAEPFSPRCEAGSCIADPVLDCTPGEKYICGNYQCPTGNGHKACEDDGYGFDDCLCD
jgi:hypothetical protein